jgi:hypothetical protein
MLTLVVLMLWAGENTTATIPAVRGGMSERLDHKAHWAVGDTRWEQVMRPMASNRWRIQYLRCRECAKRSTYGWEEVLCF